jgi:hypothetical protein
MMYELCENLLLRIFAERRWLMGRPSKKFGGTDKHNGASISQSGSQSFGRTPRVERSGSGGGSGFGGSTPSYLRVPSMSDVFKHGGTKKNRKKK